MIDTFKQSGYTVQIDIKTMFSILYCITTFFVFLCILKHTKTTRILIEKEMQKEIRRISGLTDSLPDIWKKFVNSLKKINYVKSDFVDSSWEDNAKFRIAEKIYKQNKNNPDANINTEQFFVLCSQFPKGMELFIYFVEI